MMKKIFIPFLTVVLLILMPLAGLAASTGSTNGNAGYGGAGDSQQSGVDTQSQTQNQVQSQSQIQSQNQVQTQLQNNATQMNTGTSLDPLMQTTREQLRTMTGNTTQTQEGWLEVKENLEQLKQQYRLQTQTETKEEIKSMFKNAIQVKKTEGQVEEAELLARDLISLDAKDKEAYQELGAIFRNRGEKDPKVFMNGNEVKPDVPPVIKEGRTLVPVRAITEALGAAVQWNEQEQTILISKGDTQIQLSVNNRIAMVNGQEVTVDAPAEINSDRTFVPLRFIMQAMKANINWYPDGKIIAMIE